MKKTILTATIILSFVPFSVIGQSLWDVQHSFSTHSSSFTASDTRSSVGLPNVYGKQSSDIIYIFKLTVTMDITISTCGSSVQDTYLHLLRSNGGIAAENDDYYEGGCANTYQAYIKQENLPAGTYYIVSEGYDRDGEITTRIEGTAHEENSTGGGNTLAEAINIGIKSSNFYYADTKNTNYFSNNYGYTPYNDVCYKFTTTVPMDITVSHCGSSVADTYIILAQAWGNYTLGEYGFDDNSWDTGACSNPYQAFLRMYSLEPGTYYVVSKGTTQNGNITTTIRGSVSSSDIQPGNDMSNAIDIGTKHSGFTYRDTRTNEFHTDDFQCPRETDEFYLSETSQDIFYKFTLSKMMDINIAHDGSIMDYTYVHLLNESGTCIAHNKDGMTFGGGTYSSLTINNLPAGTYYVVSEGCENTTGIITTTIQGSYNAAVSQEQNYILTTTPTIAASSIENLSSGEKNQTIQYYDGLGRLMQTTQIKNGPDYEDWVTFQEYDGYGRTSNAWLPVVVEGNNGSFVSLPAFKTKAQSIYADDAEPYSYPVYEASSLNRVLEQYGPGKSWHRNSRSVKTSYLTNINGNDTLNCIYYTITASSARDTTLTLTKVSNYGSAELFVTRTADEDGNTSFFFTDKIGRKVLSRRIQREGTTKLNYDTYYIYDDYDNLVAVLPPEAADAFKTGSNWVSATNNQLKQYVFLYVYDDLQRCIAKKLPGCKWIFYIYDKADRLIFSQDGVQRRKGQWLFTLPDAFGRICLTGTCENTSLNALSFIPVSDAVIVTRDNTTGIYRGYSLAGITLTNPKLLTVNYYDDYSFLNKSSIPEFNNTNFAYDALTGFDTYYTASAKTFLTGTLSAKLADGATPSFLGAVMYYDYMGRVIQTKSRNHLAGGMEKEYIAYNFSGQPTSRKHIHSSSAHGTETEDYRYTYDHAGRLTKTTHQLNSGTIVTLAENTYDNLGRLQSVKRNNKTALTTTYTYNIRSWIKSLSSQKYSENLFYNESYGGSKACYNGNISAMNWKTSNENITRGYSFVYNNLSMLTSAGYLENGVSSTNYQTGYNYDKHGNITSITRNGLTGTNTFGPVDHLTLSYQGNQLIKVEDSGATVNLSRSEDFVDGSHAAIEYDYDENGNMTKNLNKGISLIAYNSLNLPSKLMISNSKGQATNTYAYAADGRKLSVTKGSITTNYAGNMIYEDDYLRRILVDGGYIEDDVYHFYLTDHLGNVRVETGPNGEILQVNHYYPFGMAFGEGYDSSEQPYKYNGKEMDNELGLNWYDYGFRFYDPAIARWHVQDPKAEKYFSHSPYNYCINNPLNFVDPRGDTVAFAGAAEKAAYNDYKNTVNGRVEAYDNRTQTLRDKGKTERADKRDAKRSDNVYVQIQGELNAAESDATVFRVRMGSNISNSSGAGNVSYNSSTKEIDVNISSGGGWTTMQKISHEFKHVDQFINLELDLSPNGGGGLLYDKTDEVAAFERQNLFGTSVDAQKFVDENYSTRQEGPKSFHLLTPTEQTQYKTTKYIYHGKK